MDPAPSSAPGVGACPDDNALAEYVQGALPPDAAAWVEAHLDRCHRCASALHMLAHLTEAGDGTSEPGALPAPAHIGRYELLGTLGTGGMGVVHLARDPVLGREVALKVMRPDLFLASGGSDLRRRFDREARVLARLSHPNVVAVYDAGEADEAVFIAMEYVDGAPLSRWLTEHRPARWEIIDVFLQVGRGLQAAHAMGLVHRDVKPDNILVGRDGRARISDFGLAVPITGEGPAAHGGFEPLSRITTAGQLVGTPAYMPPEQLAGATVDARSDQYALCATLYEALLGRQVTDREQWVAATVEGRSGSGSARDRLPLPVRRVLTRGLRSEPAQRYADLADLLSDLAPATNPERWVVRRARRWAWLLLVAVGVASLAVGLWMVGSARWGPNRAAPNPPVTRAFARCSRRHRRRTPGPRRVAPPSRFGTSPASAACPP